MQLARNRQTITSELQRAPLTVGSEVRVSCISSESSVIPTLQREEETNASEVLRLLPSIKSRTFLILAAHLAAFASVSLASAYTFKAIASLPYLIGASVGAAFYFVLVIIVRD